MDAEMTAGASLGDQTAMAEREGIAEGRADAVTALFREHHLGLVRLAVLMVGDLATGEDVVQDAFERMHRKWDGLRAQGNGLAYARSAVMNGCRTVLRRRKVARRHAPALAEAPHPVSDAASAVQDRSEMAAAVRALPRRQREVVVLRYFLDLDVAEIAEMLNIAPSAVRSTNSRALDTLRRTLEES
jgi:RNA polymerase sigma-70 factor (sigma-E family)